MVCQSSLSGTLLISNITWNLKSQVIAGLWYKDKCWVRQLVHLENCHPARYGDPVTGCSEEIGSAWHFNQLTGYLNAGGHSGTWDEKCWVGLSAAAFSNKSWLSLRLKETTILFRRTEHGGRIKFRLIDPVHELLISIQPTSIEFNKYYFEIHVSNVRVYMCSLSSTKLNTCWRYLNRVRLSLIWDIAPTYIQLMQWICIVPAW